MSEINKFIEKVKTNTELQTRLGELAQQKAGLDKLTSVANEYGFNFTDDDWVAYSKERIPSDDLSGEQLTSVAGGVENTDNYSCSWWCVAKLLEVEGVKNESVLYSSHPGCW